MRKPREHYLGLALFERATELAGWASRLATLERLLGEIDEKLNSSTSSTLQ